MPPQRRLCVGLDSRGHSCQHAIGRSPDADVVGRRPFPGDLQAPPRARSSESVWVWHHAQQMASIFGRNQYISIGRTSPCNGESGISTTPVMRSKLMPARLGRGGVLKIRQFGRQDGLAVRAGDHTSAAGKRGCEIHLVAQQPDRLQRRHVVPQCGHLTGVSSR